VALYYLALTGSLLGSLLWLQARGVHAGWGRLTARLTSLGSMQRAGQLAIVAIRYGVVAYLLAGVLLVSAVPSDIAIGSAVLLLLLLVRLTWSARLRFFSLRLLVFPGMAFAVYLMHSDPGVADWLPPVVNVILLVVLLGFMFVVIRSTKEPAFQTTPTDLLVVTLAGGVGVLYQQGMIEATLVPVVLGIVVLFYAGEMIMRHMQSAWNGFTIGMLAVLAILSIKGM
jgi:hypothetical protein